jgi:Uma2 family endonuclease
VTALPQPPARLLTVAEYAQLGETTTGYTELQEGNLIMSPSSSPRHMIASGRLLLQVQSQLPDELCAVQEVDIDLELAPADQPGVVRRPDLVVVDYKAIDRLDRDGGLLRASDVLVVVEIVSPGSSSSDTSTPTPASGTTGLWTSMSR